jgi:hypothetical protein
LHVLGMPPAFVLSHDQTLKFMLPSSASGITSVRKPHLKDPLCTFLQIIHAVKNHADNPLRMDT